MKISKSEISLQLSCWVDDLSPAQLAAYDKAQQEHNAIKDKLKNLMSSNEGKEVFNGDIFSAYTFKGAVLQDYNTVVPKRPQVAPPPPVEKPRRGAPKRNASTLNYMESDDDDEDDIPLAKRVAKLKTESKALAKPASKNTKSPVAPATKQTTSAKSAKSNNTPKASPPAKSNKKSAPPPSEVEPSKNSENFRPSEVSSIGGLVLGADGKDTTEKGSTDAKEVKLQGKTFPSLVVLAKPWLKVNDMNANRSKLDSKVKLVLMLTPNKFTEWLIQEGLLKSEQKCSNHKNNELKLGVYSDASKFPYSGGYVWISECCPTRFVSVFHGSLFEAASHPPSCILKLIYHWSCQTNIQNVVQWVKVDNVYIKGVYTWLRAVCTLAIHQKCKLLGGPGKFVEVGVISLGTTSQDGQQRQVKVEVLGVLDYAEKTVRLRAIEPVSDADRNYKKRFQTILEPLTRWVHKDSTIAIDLTVDKMTLYQLGFKNIVQAAATDATAKHTNSSVMDYLRRIVPRMFQNTLSLLSRQMIQQFLDELVWRETFGTYSLQAFNNITAHIAEQTRMNTSDTLTQRLYQVATNPFKDWSVINVTSNDSPSTSTTPKRLKKPINDADYADKTDTTTPKIKTEKKDSKRDSKKDIKKVDEIKQEKKTKDEKPVKKSELKHKSDPDMKGLESTYYGVKDGLDVNFEELPQDFQTECPICLDVFDSNEKLQTHLVSHISIDGKDHQFQCLFCLEKHPSETVLSKHNHVMHPTETKTESSASYHCIICQSRFNNLNLLTSHLQKIHTQLELPYVCGACGYRSSSHRDVVRHFYDDHKNQNFLQCPICLGIFKICVKGQNVPENIQLFFNHLKQHVLTKNENKKCDKCSLAFHQRGSLKLHQMIDHLSNVKHSIAIRALFKNSVLIPAPKGKHNPKETIPYINQQKLDKLLLCMDPGKFCAECDDEIADSEHFIGVLKCLKCKYETCCQRAMLTHAGICQNVQANQNEFILDQEMHCVCGYSSWGGNSMAKHLAICQHTSAYLSVELAQENTVKRNMLDMLGLVRKDGESSRDNDHIDEMDPEEGLGNIALDNDATISLESDNNIAPVEYQPDVVSTVGAEVDELLNIAENILHVNQPTDVPAISDVIQPPMTMNDD